MNKICKDTIVAEKTKMQFVTPEQLSQMLSLPMTFIYEHTRKGSKDRIPGTYRFGKHLRFKLEDVERWIRDHEKGL